MGNEECWLKKQNFEINSVKLFTSTSNKNKGRFLSGLYPHRFWKQLYIQKSDVLQGM
jgi:hypothetical protein